MKLEYLSEVCFDKLSDELENNKDYYNNKEVWIDEYFNEMEYTKTSAIEAALPSELFCINSTNEDDLKKEDLTNSRDLYNSLRHLSEYQAANKYLWTYLAHKKYWPYMIHRWPPAEHAIKDRFFCGDSRRSIGRNGIAKLWWAAHVTYDASKKDPFELTNILFMDSDLYISLMERECFCSKSIMQGTLSAIKQYYDIKNILPKREVRRSLAKFINRRGGVTLLDTYNSDEIKDLVLGFLNKNI